MDIRCIDPQNDKQYRPAQQRPAQQRPDQQRQDRDLSQARDRGQKSGQKKDQDGQNRR